MFFKGFNYPYVNQTRGSDFNDLENENLDQLEEHKRLENSSASKIQRTWRMYKFRKQMNLFRSSAIKIQKWFKYDMKDRIAYLKLRRGTIFLQKIIKLRFQEKKQAATLIQKTWRMFLCRKQFRAKIKAALILQKWWRHLKEHRIRFLKLKRSMPVVEAKLHALIAKRNHAACVIQRVYRMYKFRREMKKYRNAALKIQTWTRSMSQRYLFLRSKYAIYRIQMLYRNVYMPKRHAAAKVIQKTIRSYIQKKLSVYGERLSGGHMLTLGARMGTDINTLSRPCEIGRITVALRDLDKVTSLSPECCFTFIREGALEYLYSFISACNSSIPHLDLVKYCLRVSEFFFKICFRVGLFRYCRSF